MIAFSLVTYLSVVLGELMPKALTLDRAETLAALVARPMELISVALWPAVWVLQGSASVLLRPFGIRDVVAGEGIRTAAELRALVDEAEGSGVIPRAQEELLHNVFDFADREAADIMVPALDVDWLEAGLTAEAALDRVLEAPHERYPVGHGSLDHLDGVVHVRDLLAGARRNPGTTVGELARPVLAVPETKDLGALLRELRERKEQLAVVLNEYGAVSGIVTVEDILEEIVGEIEDEFDLPDARITRIDEQTVDRVRLAQHRRLQRDARHPPTSGRAPHARGPCPPRPRSPPGPGGHCDGRWRREPGRAPRRVEDHAPARNPPRLMSRSPGSEGAFQPSVGSARREVEARC